MKKLVILYILPVLLNPNAALAALDESPGVGANDRSTEFLSVNVERVEVDMTGLTTASATLAGSIDRLALAIGQLSEDGANLSDDEKKILLDSVQSAQQASAALTDLARKLPQATEHATQLVNSALDAALQRLTLYTILLVAIVALALIGIMWFIYRQYLRPLTLKLDELVGAPEHFDNMARHMRDTSSNLQLLQDRGTRGRVRGADRFRRG